MSKKNVQWKCVSRNTEGFKDVIYPDLDTVLNDNQNFFEIVNDIEDNQDNLDLPDNVGPVENNQDVNEMPLLGVSYDPQYFDIDLPDGTTGPFMLYAPIPNTISKKYPTHYKPVHNDTHIVDANKEKNNNLGVENGLSPVPDLTKERDDTPVTAYHGPNVPGVSQDTDVTPPISAVASAPGIVSALVQLITQGPTLGPTEGPTAGPTAGPTERELIEAELEEGELEEESTYASTYPPSKKSVFRYMKSKNPKKMIKKVLMYITVALVIYLIYLLSKSNMNRDTYVYVLVGIVVAYVIYYYLLKNKKIKLY